MISVLLIAALITTANGIKSYRLYKASMDSKLQLDGVQYYKVLHRRYKTLDYRPNPGYRQSNGNYMKASGGYSKSYNFYRPENCCVKSPCWVGQVLCGALEQSSNQIKLPFKIQHQFMIFVVVISIIFVIVTVSAAVYHY